LFEFIHAVVETLNAFFGNVCELDILFNMDKVYLILEDMINSVGHVVNTNRVMVLASVKAATSDDEDDLTRFLFGVLPAIAAPTPRPPGS
jgi:hypothetical protein